MVCRISQIGTSEIVVSYSRYITDCWSMLFTCKVDDFCASLLHTFMIFLLSKRTIAWKLRAGFLITKYVCVKLEVKFKALEDRKSGCKIKLQRLIFDDLLEDVFSKMIIMYIEF